MMAVVAMRRLFAGTIAAALMFGFAQHGFADAVSDYEEGYKAQGLGDFSRALPLLKQSADKGYGPAQSLLAELWEAAGANEDALAYYTKAADQGDPRGELGLAKMYASGKAVKQDNAKALELLKRAAEKDYGEALKVMVSSYTNGVFGLPVDLEQAKIWNARFRKVEDKAIAERAKAEKERAEKEKADKAKADAAQGK